MPDIDLDSIRPGDTVRVRYLDEAMRRAGVPAMDFPPTVAYLGRGGELYAGPFEIVPRMRGGR